ncbi:MAG: hypothetical protein ACOC00_08665 [Halothiobacillaceae bacterium]
MKRVLVACLVWACGLGSAGVAAAPVDEAQAMRNYCAALSAIAAQFARAHQGGLSRLQALEIAQAQFAEDHPMHGPVRALLDEVQAMPRLEDADERARWVQTYRDQVQLRCLRAF